MQTENVSTLKIHKLTKAQYDREKEAGNLDETALYLTPDEEIDLSSYATTDEVNEALASSKTYTNEQIAAIPTPDVSGQISTHNTSTTAHTDIRNLISTHTEDIDIHVTADDKAAWNGKQDAITGAATTIADSDLTVSRALVSNESGKVAVSDITATELGYLEGATSNIQTQITGVKAATDNLTNYVGTIPEEAESEDVVNYIAEKITNIVQYVDDAVANSANVQPDWSQNSPDAKDYIKNRPFYTEGEDVAVVTWDGDTTGLTTNNNTYYKVSDFTCTLDEFKKMYYIQDDGTKWVVANQYPDQQSDDAVLACSDFGPVIVLSTDNSGVSGGIPYPFTETGTWFHTDIRFLMLSEEIIHPINEKYLPFSIDKTPTDSSTNPVQSGGVYKALSEKMDTYNPVGTGSFSMGRKADTTVGDYSFAEGNSTTASGFISHAEGSSTTASGSQSHAEGNSTTASGSYSHAEGRSTIASGFISHAEGSSTTASGSQSHAEGSSTTASGSYSHAEGSSTIASGFWGSHAEGNGHTGLIYLTGEAGATTYTVNEWHENIATSLYIQNNSTARIARIVTTDLDNLTITVAVSLDDDNSLNAQECSLLSSAALGVSSHVEGRATVASGYCQHVQGQWNVSDDASTYAHIVGNGEGSSFRSNAHTLDWNGNAWFAGDVYVGSTSGTNRDEGSVRLVSTADLTLVDLSNVSVGDTFNYGKYQVESEDPWAVEWEVVDDTDPDYIIAQTKSIIDLRSFDAIESSNTDSSRSKYGNNNWNVSNIKQFLNSDSENWYSSQHTYDTPPNSSNVYNSYNPYDTHKGFLYYFSDIEKSYLQDMTLTLANNTVTDGGGSYTWTGKVWLPTFTQMSGNTNNSISEGTQFSKYTDNSSRIKYIHEKCAENNSYCIDYGYSSSKAWQYWMSSANPSTSGLARFVDSDGDCTSTHAYNGYDGLAPCIKLPRKALNAIDLSSYSFITTDDIDEICNATIVNAAELTY